MKILDLSMTLDNECLTCNVPWHEKVNIERLGEIEKVGRNTSKFRLGSHSATHMDAPSHFFEGGKGIDELDLDLCVGEVTCVDLTGKKAGEVVTVEDLQNTKVTERMLFVFGWHEFWKTEDYYKGFPYFEESAIQYLLDNGIRLVAMDTPSPDTVAAIEKKDDSPMHKMLLKEEVIIVEYLCNTDKIDFSKKYEIIALPLKIKGADGCPARVILKEV